MLSLTVTVWPVASCSASRTLDFTGTMYRPSFGNSEVVHADCGRNHSPPRSSQLLTWDSDQGTRLRAR